MRMKIGIGIVALVSSIAGAGTRVEVAPLGFQAVTGRVIGETAYVVTQEGSANEIRRVGLDGVTRDRFSVGTFLPVDMDVEGSRLSVTGLEGERSELRVLCLQSGKTLAAAELDGTGRVRVGFGRIFVGGRSEVRALSLSPEGLKVDHVYRVEGLLSSFAFSGDKLVVVENYPGGFKVVDARSGTLLVDKPVHPWLYDVAVSGTLAFVEKMAIPSKMAGVIDLSDIEALSTSEEPVKELDLDDDVAPVAASESLLFVRSRWDGEAPVLALDPRSLVERGRFNLGFEPAPYGSEPEARGNRFCLVGESQIGCAFVE